MRVECYYAHIDPHDTQLLARLWAGLPAPRRQVATARREADRIESAAISALLMQAVTGWVARNTPSLANGMGFCIVNADTLQNAYPEWECDPGGKPFPHGIATPAGRVYVSVSHSHGHLLVALADRPVGADLQAVNVPPLSSGRFRRLDTRIRHPQESPADTPLETARRFSAKEAALKVRGEGLSRRMNTVLVTEQPPTADGHRLFCHTVTAGTDTGVVAVAVSR